MSRGTPHRNIRVPDELWKQAQDKAAKEGTTVTAYLIASLRRWVAKG